MNIDDLKIGEAKQLAAMFSGGSHDDSPWEVGTSYLIRTVTMTLTGRLVRVTPKELVLEDAAWIADTGRFHNALSTGSLAEVEPFESPVIVGRGAVIDATKWSHALPRSQR